MRILDGRGVEFTLKEDVLKTDMRINGGFSEIQHGPNSLVPDIKASLLSLIIGWKEVRIYLNSMYKRGTTYAEGISLRRPTGCSDDRYRR